MADDQTSESSPTIPQNKQITQPDRKKVSPPKKQNSKTIKQGAGLNKIKQDQLVKWTIHVQEETRTFVGKAVVKAGLTQTDWIDSRLQQAARDELATKPKSLPAKPEDVADLMSQLERRLADQQTQTAKEQADQIKQLTDVINNRPANLKEWLFGKPKKD
jgi:hypothetical protein